MFNVSNGVKQGGVLSPILFNVYMDDLSSDLSQISVATSSHKTDRMEERCSFISTPSASSAAHFPGVPSPEQHALTFSSPLGRNPLRDCVSGSVTIDTAGSGFDSSQPLIRPLMQNILCSDADHGIDFPPSLAGARSVGPVSKHDSRPHSPSHARPPR